MSRNKSSRARKCPLCGRAMRGNGFTGAGSQRWRCDGCRSSSTARRDDSRRMAEFRAFLAWVTGKESRGEAGRELPGLARRLVRATTADEAAAWLKELNDRHGRHDDHLKERTVAKQDPMHARGRKWWRTHERLRRAYFRLVRPNRAGVLFAFCDPAVLKGGGPLPSTTNQLEGGVNAVAKRALDHHRGSSEEHMRRCREWAVYMLAERPGPMALVTPEHWRTRKGKPAGNDGPMPGTMTAVQEPTDGVDAYESGFGIRKGWAGRST